MFAPPPVQLSRADIEARRGKRQSAGASTIASSGSPARSMSTAGSDPKNPSLLRAESHSPKSKTSPKPSPKPTQPSGRRNWFFGRSEKGDKATTSSPAVAAPEVLLEPQGPPPEPPKQHPGDRAASRRKSDDGKPKTLSEAFGENPRRAPAPPRRPPRPSNDEIPPIPGAFPLAQPATPPPQRPVPVTPTLSPQKQVLGPFAPPPSEAPPPIPQKSPKRSGGAKKPALVDPFKNDPFGGASLNDALEKLRLEKDAKSQRSRNASPASTLSARKKSKASPCKTSQGSSKSNRRHSGSHNGKIEKAAIEKTTVSSNRRSSAAAKVRSALAELDEINNFRPPKAPRRATDSELQVRAEVPQLQDQSWKRRQKGETLSMLLDNDFFPVQEYIYNPKNPNISIKVPFPPPLNMLHKDLPRTPSSIVPTPTELYQFSPTRPSHNVETKRKATGKRRSPLGAVSTTSVKTNSTNLPVPGLDSEISPSRLSAIPEGSMVSENTPPTSGMSTPVATKIHLRGGSVITLTPPELSAWRQTYYIPGAIKLPEPAILPRKGSTASMDAFQSVVEQVYQEALFIPRRRSDDQIVDDIVSFIDDFSFDEVGFGGDVLGVADIVKDEMEDIVEEGADLARFTTPPPEVEATPVERVFAKEIVERSAAKPAPLLLPPVETEETLRAKGIARLAGPPSPTSSLRRSSMAIRKDSTVLPLFPVPEKDLLSVPPMPTASRKSSSATNRDVDMLDSPVAVRPDQGFDWDDSVEELDASSTWVASGGRNKYGIMQRGVSKRETKNPVTRMRRLVATASAIL